MHNRLRTYTKKSTIVFIVCVYNEIQNRMNKKSPRIVSSLFYRSEKFQVITLGILSAVLYVILFEYSDVIVSTAQETTHGHKEYAVVPIVVPFVFSLVHGSFTGMFWHIVGLRPNPTHTKKK